MLAAEFLHDQATSARRQMHASSRSCTVKLSGVAGVLDLSLKPQPDDLYGHNRQLVPSPDSSNYNSSTGDRKLVTLGCALCPRASQHAVTVKALLLATHERRRRPEEVIRWGLARGL